MERNTAWGEFLYNEEAVVSILREGCPIPEVLKAGLAWNGAGWTTTRAAVSLRALTSVALVSTDVEDYRDSFLYSLALAAGVEVQSLRLKDKGADAAFALYERWARWCLPEAPGDVKRGPQERGEQGEPRVVPGDLSGRGLWTGAEKETKTRTPHEEEDTEEEREEEGMSWDTPEVNLPPDLLILRQRALGGPGR